MAKDELGPQGGLCDFAEKDGFGDRFQTELSSSSPSAPLMVVGDIE